MQIHELSARKPVDEGLITDPIRAAAKTVKTGYQQGGLKGAAKSAVSPTAYKSAMQDVQNTDAAKAMSGLQQKGYGQPADTPSIDQSIATVQKNPQLQQYIQGLTQQWMKVAPTVSATASATTTNSRTGGKVAGQVSQTPNAVRKRNARAASGKSAATTPATAGAGAFGQMARQLSTTGQSSTGGQTQSTPTGLKHTANPNNPNIAKVPASTLPAATTPAATTPAATTPKSKPSYGKAPAPGNISEPIFLGGKKLDPKKPNDAQVIAAMKKQGVHEAAVNPSDNYLTAFRNWANKILQVPLATLENDPELAKKLKAAQTEIVASAGTDPTKAINNFLSLAIAGIQNIESNKTSTNPNNKPTSPVDVNLAQDLGAKLKGIVDNRQLSQIGGILKSGGSGLLKDTGNPSVNEFLKAMGFRI
jgi:hypothetical protein